MHAAVATPASARGTPLRHPAAPAPRRSRLGTEEYHSARAAHRAGSGGPLLAPTTPRPRSALLKRRDQGRRRAQQQAGVAHALRPLPGRAPTAQEFDALSMLFTVKFEQSPPAWIERRRRAAATRGARQSRERKDFFALKPDADGELAADIDKFRRLRREARARCAWTWRKIDAHHRRGGDAARRRARAAAQAQPADVVQQPRRAARRCCARPSTRRPRRIERPTGCCSSSCCILQGKHRGVRGAGAGVRRRLRDVAAQLGGVREQRRRGGGEVARGGARRRAARAPEAGFELKGVLSAASANQIAELNGYAASRPRWSST